MKNTKVEIILDEIVKQSFPRGERKWCVECAKRIKKELKERLKQYEKIKNKQ